MLPTASHQQSDTCLTITCLNQTTKSDLKHVFYTVHVEALQLKLELPHEDDKANMTLSSSSGPKLEVAAFSKRGPNISVLYIS